MFQKLSLAALLLFLLFACKNQSMNPSVTNAEIDNKKGNSAIFEKPFDLPYNTIPFDKIHDEDYLPAFEKGMQIHLAEIDSIINQTAAPDFQNTIVAMEKSGRMLSRVNNAFNVVSGANTNDYLQKLQEVIAPKLAAHSDAIYLNEKLFQKVESVYNNRANLRMDAEDTRLLDKYYTDFVMAGARLSAADKARLKKLNEENALKSATFTNKLLAGTKAGQLVVNSEAELKGLSAEEINAAVQKAQESGFKDKLVVALINTTQQPALTYLQNRNTRENLFSNSWTRTEKNDSNDTRATILELARIRAEKAKILGYKNYAAWVLQDQMAKNPENVMNFLQKLNGSAVKIAQSEAKEIQQEIHSKGEKFELQPWDWNYYAEIVRKKKYDLDENDIKPYFDADSVLIKGAFFAANKLYGISFKPRNDIPVYNPDVRVYEIFDADNQPMALYYCDFYKRDNKNGGAWMSNMVDQSKLLGTKPVIYNVFNYAKPTQGPSLISFDDVITIFHEFGHTLHGLFADQKYVSLSGTATPRDFVEYPSQINEYWALDPTVLKNYARHYQTGEVIPQALINKILKAASFNQGYNTTEVLEAANIDMAWHTLSAGSVPTDVDTFEKKTFSKLGFNIPQVPPRYRSSYFMHIWANDYGSGYYAYLWSEMLDKDTRKWFAENGGINRKNGDYFRKMILSKGSTVEFAKLYKDFRGKDPDIQYFLKEKGLL